jgi:spore coat protein U-like protein
MRFRFALIAAIALVAGTTPAHAVLCGTVIAGLPLDPISVTPTALVFGNYTPTTATATSLLERVTVSCGLLNIDLLPSFTVALGFGNNASGTQRRMAQGTSDFLKYNIYTTSAANAPIWGDGTNGTQTLGYSAVLSLGSTKFDGTATLPVSQFVKPGGYSDTVTVTVTF